MNPVPTLPPTSDPNERLLASVMPPPPPTLRERAGTLVRSVARPDLRRLQRWLRSREARSCSLAGVTSIALVLAYYRSEVSSASSPAAPRGLQDVPTAAASPGVRSETRTLAPSFALRNASARSVDEARSASGNLPSAQRNPGSLSATGVAVAGVAVAGPSGPGAVPARTESNGTEAAAPGVSSAGAPSLGSAMALEGAPVQDGVTEEERTTRALPGPAGVRSGKQRARSRHPLAKKKSRKSQRASARATRSSKGKESTKARKSSGNAHSAKNGRATPAGPLGAWIATQKTRTAARP